MRGIIACAIVVAGCTTRDVTYEIEVTNHHADEELRINGTAVDTGGPVPRTLTVMYDFASWPDAEQATYTLEAYYMGGKTGQYMVSPGWCAHTAGSDLEKTELVIDTTGMFGPDCSICYDVTMTRIGGDCP